MKTIQFFSKIQKVSLWKYFLIKIIKGKLQLTYMWFDWNLSCLPVVWNLTLYLLEVSLIRFLKSISVKTKVKYVLLLNFYVSFLQKHKNTRSNKKKKNPTEHLHHEISNHWLAT